MDIKYELERKYNMIKFEISMLEEQLSTLNNDYGTSITPTYSGMPTGKGGTSDKVYDKVVKLDSERDKLISLINSKNDKIKMLDNLIKTQNYKAQKIIELRAFEKMDFNTIASELSLDFFTTGSAKRIYYKSIKNMQEIADKIINKGE